MAQNLTVTIQAIDEASKVFAEVSERLSAITAAAKDAKEALDNAGGGGGLFSGMLGAVNSVVSGVTSFGSSILALPFNVLESGWSMIRSGISLFFELTGSISNVLNVITTLGSGVSWLAGQFVSLGQSAFSTFSGAVNKAKDFEKQMSNVAAVASANDDEFKALRQSALDVGQVTSLSASQAAEALYNLASGGFSATQATQALMGVARLAEATQSDLAMSSSSVASALNQFNISANESERVANLFTAAINQSALQMPTLSAAMVYAGPAAASFNVSLEQTVGILGMLSKAGIDGSVAGTGLAAALRELAMPGKLAAGALKELGLTQEQVNPATKNLVDILALLEARGITVTQAIKLFGAEAGPKMMALINQGSGALKEMITNITGTQAASATAITQLNNLSGSVEQMKGSWETVTIAIGSQFTGGLKMAVDMVLNAINAFLSFDAQTAIIKNTLGLFNTVAGFANQILTQMVTALAPIGAAFTNLVAPLSATIGQFTSGQVIMQAWAGLMTTLKPAFDALGVAATALGTTIQGLVEPFTKWLAQFTTYKQEMFAFSAATEDSAASIIGMGEKTKTGSSLMNSAFQLIGQGISSFISIITNVITKVNDWIKAQGSIEAILEKFGPMISNLAGVFTPWLNMIGLGIDKLTEFANSLTTSQRPVDTFIAAMTGLTGWFKNISEAAAATVGNVIEFGVKVAEALSGIDLSKVKFDLAGIVKLALDAAWAVIKTAASLMIQSGKDLLVSLAKGIKDNASVMALAVSDVLKSIGNWIKGNVAEFSDLGKSILDAIATSFNDNKDVLYAAFGTLMSGIGEAIKLGGDISASVGGFILEMITKAIEFITPGVIAVGQKIKDAIMAWSTSSEGETSISAFFDNLKSKITSAISALGPIIQTAWDTVSIAFKATVAAGLDEIAKLFGLDSKLGQAIAGISTVFKTNLEGNIDFSVLTDAVRQFVDEVYDIINTKFKNAVGVDIKSALEVAGAALIGFNALPALASIVVILANIGGAATALVTAFSFIGPAFTLAGTIITGVGTVLTTFLGGPLTAAVIAAGAFAAAYETNFLGFKDLVDGVIADVTAKFDEWGVSWETLQQTWDATWADIGKTIDSGAKKIGEVIAGIVTSAVTKWNQFKTESAAAWNAIESGMATAWDSMIKTAGTVLDEISGALESLWDYFMNLPDKMMEWGKNAASAWVNGIIDTISNAAKSIGEAARDACASLVGMSPPKVGPLKEIDKWGSNVGQAWTDGLSQSVADSSKAIEPAMSELKKTLTGFTAGDALKMATKVGENSLIKDASAFAAEKSKVAKIVAYDQQANNQGFGYYSSPASSNNLGMGYGAGSDLAMGYGSTNNTTNKNDSIVINITGPITIGDGNAGSIDSIATALAQKVQAGMRRR